MRRLVFALSLLPAACAPTLAERYDIAGLDRAIQRYYAEHDLREPVTTCIRPRIRTFTKVETVESTAERLVIDVRYTYWDRADHDGPLDILLASRRCDGFATRRFTIDPTKGRVIDASGPRRVLR